MAKTDSNDDFKNKRHQEMHSFTDNLLCLHCQIWKTERDVRIKMNIKTIMAICLIMLASSCKDTTNDNLPQESGSLGP